MARQVEESEKKSRLVASALLRLQALQRSECLDPNDPESRPTPSQKSILDDFGKIKHQYIRAGSQGGKTSVCARLVSWFLTNTHPTWKHPEHWHSEPLLIIVAGRTGKQIEDSLLPRILGYLDSSTYKVVRIGNIVQRLELNNGNRVIFQSLENPTMARERLQSYTAHLAWVDELPPTLEILAELHRSIQAKNGQFLASFTPLTPNYDIQQYIDSAETRQPGYARVYRLQMLDNPVYSDETRRGEILRGLEGMTEKQRNARLYGDWLTGDENVYEVDSEQLFRKLPDSYTPYSWRHVVSVDPAMESATGLTIWAEDPRQGDWYCILAEHITGMKTPTDWVNAVQKRTSMFNVIRRISDVAPWFTSTAYAEGKITYSTVQNKSGRKQELIANLQKLLGVRLFLVAAKCGPLMKELQDCRWSTRVNNSGNPVLVNSQTYHCLDTAQYFADNIPRSEVASKGLMGDGIQASTWEDWLYKANEKRKQQEAAKRGSSVERITRTRRW